MSPSLQLLSYLSEIPTVRLIVVCVHSWLMFAIKCSVTKQLHMIHCLYSGSWRYRWSNSITSIIRWSSNHFIHKAFKSGNLIVSVKECWFYGAILSVFISNKFGFIIWYYIYSFFGHQYYYIYLIPWIIWSVLW
jgi:hypothetical protein